MHLIALHYVPPFYCRVDIVKEIQTFLHQKSHSNYRLSRQLFSPMIASFSPIEKVDTKNNVQDSIITMFDFNEDKE